jgi:predicted XRE-type DNA-binding protein
MAGTTGLEPAISHVTGRWRKRGYRAFRSIFNSLRESQRASSGATTVRATVLDNRLMPVLAYNGNSIGMKMPNRESTPSSGNVFADLNLPRADDLLAKAELTSRIIAEIQRRRMTQAQAAEILRIDQPKISALKQGKLSGFSVERLMRFLLLLGRDIEIAVKDKPRTRPTARLRVA